MFWLVYWPLSCKLESYSHKAFFQNTLHLLWKEKFRVFRCNACGTVIIYSARQSNKILYAFVEGGSWMKSAVFSLNVYYVMFSFIQTNKKFQKWDNSISAGTWRLKDVDVTSLRRIDINTTSFRRHVPAGIWSYNQLETFSTLIYTKLLYHRPDRIAQSVGHLTCKSGVLGSIPGLARYFRFSFRFFKKGSCQLLAKVCALSTEFSA